MGRSLRATADAAVRRIETRAYAVLRSPAADSVGAMPTVEWDVERLRGHRHCLLVTHRRDGRAVATPMWFAIAHGLVYVRAAASDGKLKRIRRRPDVLVAACTPRGTPLGPPMVGIARRLGDAEREAAELALRSSHGLARRLYGATRGLLLDAAHLEIGPP